MSKSWSAFLLITAFAIGCVAAQVAPQMLTVPPARAGTHPQKWEYVCGRVVSSKQLQKWANELGQQGWQMSGAAGGMAARGEGLGATEQAHYVWCFTRPIP